MEPQHMSATKMMTRTGKKRMGRTKRKKRKKRSEVEVDRNLIGVEVGEAGGRFGIQNLLEI